MKVILNLLTLFLIVAFSACSNKTVKQSFHLPKVSSIDEKEEVFLQKKILINKRKKDLVDNIEHELIQDAVINNNFEVYD